jgi:hypothetical protein
VSPKNLALIAAAVAVLIMGVYLFIQVKSTPAQAQSSATSATVSRAPDRAANTPPTQPPIAKPLRAPPQPAPAPAPIHVGNATIEPPATAEDQRANPRFDSMMELANKAYDSQDFDQAIAIAGKVLSKDPTNVRMLRIMVSANCIGGDAALAQQHYERLPKGGADREQMRLRCDRYQVTLKD